jgi:hypothetical protein
VVEALPVVSGVTELTVEILGLGLVCEGALRCAGAMNRVSSPARSPRSEMA